MRSGTGAYGGADRLSRASSAEPIFSSKDGQGGECFQDIIAASFAAAEKALIECHAEASCLIAKCADEARQQEAANLALVARLAAHGDGSAHDLLVDRVSMPRVSGTDSTRQPPPALALGQLDVVELPGMNTPRTPRSEPRKLGWLDGTSPAEGQGDQADGFRPPSASKPPSLPHERAPSMDLPGSVPIARLPTYESELRAPSLQPPGRMDTNSPHPQRRTSKSPDSRSLEGSRSDGGRQRSKDPSLRQGAQTATPRASDRPASREVPRKLTRRPSIASNASQGSYNQAYELLPFWEARQPGKKKLKRSNSQRSMTSCMSQVSSFAVSEDTDCCSRVIVRPSSRKRVAWEIASIAFLMYDLVVVPLLFFEIKRLWWISMMSWVTRLFWTYDIPFSFLTGRLRPDGTHDMNALRIAKGYFCSWFLVDLAIVCGDWVGVVDDSPTVRTVSRLIRMLRLLRLARMRNIFRLMMEKFQSEQLMLVAGIIQVMLIIMGLGHMIACMWYGIATQDRPDTWILMHNFEDASVPLKYTTALHWSLLQFAGGTDEIVPQNTSERVYAIFVFLLAFIMAAIFVGRLTSSMTQLSMLAQKDMERLQVLKRYLFKNEISSRLAMRVLNNAQHALKERQRFMEEKGVELLDVISEPLRNELRFELYSPVLAVHPLFACYVEVVPQVMKKVCHSAVSQLLASSGDVIFTLGEVPSQPRMLVVCSGELTYHEAGGEVTTVTVRNWISEAALWTNWTYQGTLVALSDCRLCALDAIRFQELVETFDHSDFDLKRYAKAFVQTMNEGTMQASDLPFDEDVDVPEIAEVIKVFEARCDRTQMDTSVVMEEQDRRPSWQKFWFGSSHPSPDEISPVPTAPPRRSVLMPE